MIKQIKVDEKIIAIISYNDNGCICLTVMDRGE